MNKTILKNLLVVAIAILTTFGVSSCKKEVQAKLAEAPLNPRFNLQYTNEKNVDLDLHVLTPNGKEIYFENYEDDNGSLDSDCLPTRCVFGPEENIFWEEGKATKGTYKVWVVYYSGIGTSDFTLRVMLNERVINTYTGTLINRSDKSAEYTFVLN